MAYGCKMWSLTGTQLKKLVTTLRKMKRTIEEAKLKNRKIKTWSGNIEVQQALSGTYEKTTKEWRGIWQGEMITYGMSELQNEYPVKIRDLRANQNRQ